MIIFEDGTYQMTNGHPNENYLAELDCKQPKWVVDDNSELARKILSATYWEPVEDENGNLIDITVAKAAVFEQSNENKIEELKAQLDEIDRQAIRPLRAIAAGTDTEEDTKMLADLETQAETIRAKIAELSEGKECNNGHTDIESGA